MEYLIIVTPTESGFRAQVPDVDGVVATGRTREQVERQIRAALEFHITDLRHRGGELPPARSYTIRAQVMAATYELTTVG